MCEIKDHPYLKWSMWPVWPENFQTYANTGRLIGKIETTLTPEIERVIFNGPATIVFWSDNTKTIVKCMEGEFFDEEKGIAMAFLKKMYGSGYMRKIRRHIPTHAFVEEGENGVQ